EDQASTGHICRGDLANAISSTTISLGSERPRTALTVWGSAAVSKPSLPVDGPLRSADLGGEAAGSVHDLAGLPKSTPFHVPAKGNERLWAAAGNGGKRKSSGLPNFRFRAVT